MTSVLCWTFLSDEPSFLLFWSDRCMLLCGMFSFDPERPEDSVRRGHHCNLDSQEKEGSSEEKTGTPLHQLLSDHVIHKPRDHSASNHKPNLDWRQKTDKRKMHKRGDWKEQKTRAKFKLQGSWKGHNSLLLSNTSRGCSLLPKEHKTQVSLFFKKTFFASKVPSFITIFNHFSCTKCCKLSCKTKQKLTFRFKEKCYIWSSYDFYGFWKLDFWFVNLSIWEQMFKSGERACSWEIMRGWLKWHCDSDQDSFLDLRPQFVFFI